MVVGLVSLTHQAAVQNAPPQDSVLSVKVSPKAGATLIAEGGCPRPQANQVCHSWQLCLRAAAERAVVVAAAAAAAALAVAVAVVTSAA